MELLHKAVVLFDSKSMEVMLAARKYLNYEKNRSS